MKIKFLLIVLGIFLISLASSADVSYCCEKLNSGAWCQNAQQDSCDENYRSTPTSCDSTSYCRLGTCIDSSEGTCLTNTPQKVCEEDGGVWDQRDAEDLPQCDLGCCLMGDQASFVTQARCKKISLLYGLETNFRTDLSNELTCIASVTSDVEGACVFEKEFEKTCLRLTQKECAEIASSADDGNVEFHKDYLCSAESLATNCGKSRKTTCVEGKDEVYFLDTCGNIANIYDATKINNNEYWGLIKDKLESCNVEDSNADSASCGNCNYYLGSTCKSYSASEDKRRPAEGDNICRDLSCEYDGKKYEHGETWCADSEGSDENLPGSRHFRLICYNGEVSIEPCADFRQETCIESEVNEFRTAACRVNRWQDCLFQVNEKDCENEDRRDCQWIETDWEPVEGDTPGVLNANGSACIPEYTPGFNFWEAGNAEEICSTASTVCNVVFEVDLFGDEKCIENCECLEDEWVKEMNSVCNSVGDCGNSTNFIGIKGYHDGEAWYSGKAQEENSN